MEFNRTGTYSLRPGLEEVLHAPQTVLTPKEAEKRLNEDFLVGVLLNNRSKWFKDHLTNFCLQLKLHYQGRDYMDQAAMILGYLDGMLDNPKLDLNTQSRLRNFPNANLPGNYTYAQIHTQISRLKIKTHNGDVDEKNFIPVMSMSYICMPTISSDEDLILGIEGDKIETYALLSAYAPSDHRALDTFLMLMSGTDGRNSGHPLASAGIDYILANVASVEAKVRAELWADLSVSLTLSDTVGDYGLEMYEEVYALMEADEKNHRMVVDRNGDGKYNITLILMKE